MVNCFMDMKLSMGYVSVVSVHKIHFTCTKDKHNNNYCGYTEMIMIIIILM